MLMGCGCMMFKFMGRDNSLVLRPPPIFLHSCKIKSGQRPGVEGRVITVVAHLWPCMGVWVHAHGEWWHNDGVGGLNENLSAERPYHIYINFMLVGVWLHGLYI